MNYSVYQDGGIYDTFTSFELAESCAEVLLAAVEEPATFTVEDCDNCKVLSSFTNRRITGIFYKQVWRGPKNDTAETVEEVGFDATDSLLLMDRESLVSLRDGDYSSDEIGRDHVSWDGPCDVYIVESICSYFGVQCIAQITDELLAHARQLANPQPLEETTATLTVKVRIRKAQGTETDDILTNMDYRFISATPGAVIVDTEITDWEA